MTKPISPRQAREAVRPADKRAHLKKLVVRRCNRELKKGLHIVKVPNDIDHDLAVEIANDFRALGWDVSLTDRHTYPVSDAGNKYRMPSACGGECWRYEFKP